MASRRRFLRLVAGAAFGAVLRPRRAAPRSIAPPIEHVVILVRENHSYDNYFGTFPGGDGKTAGSRCEDERPDPPHLRDAAVRGVTVGVNGDCHYLEEDIPNYFAYAREFVLCDRYYADVLASSYPNYFLMMAAETPTLQHIPGDTRGRYELPTIMDRLSDGGVSWRNYNGGLPVVSMFKRALASGNVVPLSSFAEDAATGSLPAVSWLTPSLADSEHPPYSVRRGENWTVRHVNALMNGPRWPKTAILVVWDEWGGFWDHVKPPVVEKEKGLFAPAIRYGYRVPCLVLGAYARRGHVSHTLYSHVSVLRTIERIFDVAPLNERDAGANDLLDCFDFAQAPRQPVVLRERA